MKPFYDDGSLQVWQGDCRAALAALPEASVHAVVTSPPYWGLRDYGIPPSVWGGDAEHAHEWGSLGKRKDILPADVSTLASRVGTDVRQGGTTGGGRFCSCGAWQGVLGLEPTPDLFVEHMVDVFRAVARVLRPDGTLWLNLGDSFTSGGRRGVGEGGQDGGAITSRIRERPEGLKPKDLVGIPWRVAFALQADGWYLRRDVIWAKPNPMPESVEDRPVSAHEYLFLLARSERYYYDHEAVREPVASSQVGRVRADVIGGSSWAERGQHSPGGRYATPNSPGSIKSPHGQGFTRRAQARPAGWNDGATEDDRVGRYKTDALAEQPGSVARRGAGFNERWDAAEQGEAKLSRNLRSWWVISTEPYPGAHFATFPQKLVEPCIRASTSERGVCPDCGAPWVRVVEREPGDTEAQDRPKRTRGMDSGTSTLSLSGNGSREWAERGPRVATLGWRPSCRHGGRPDDLEVIRTPTGPGEGGEFHRSRLTAGRGGPVTRRRGLDRERGDEEGTRPMYRWQQRAIAEQIRTSPDKVALAHEAAELGYSEEAFAHWMRTDRSGARAVPERLLAAWIERGVLTWPTDDPAPAHEPIPAVVLDPFGGSGTVALVAERLGRQAVLVEISEGYIEQALERVASGRRSGEGPALDMDLAAPEDSLWAFAELPPEDVPVRPYGLSGGAYAPPGQSPHSNARRR